MPGDDPAQVASGPTVADHTTRDMAVKAIENYNITLTPRLQDALQTAPVTAPTPDDPRLAANEVHVIASAQRSLQAAAQLAQARGINAVILSDTIEGEARDIAQMHAAMARSVRQYGMPFAAPVVMLSGGETTVTLRGTGGKGGRNGEFQLSLACALDGATGIYALAADTDGIDGSENNAGAFADGTSAARMRAAGVDPMAHLSANNSWTAFHAIDDLFEPGPTGTNVNDFRAIYIV